VADLIEISSGALTAAINPFGAELSSLKDAKGRELMTDANPAFWGGRAPLLFPIVGRVNGDALRVDGQSYPMPKHGFARKSPFALVTHSADQAQFRLTDSAATRAAYPFAFQLDVTFAVEGASVLTKVAIFNPAAEPLYTSFGFHPAFAWPLPYGAPRMDHRVRFASAEPGRLKAITADGLIAAEDRASPVADNEILLTDALFADDALVWDPVTAQGLRYGPPTGPALDISFPNTPRLGIWTKPGAAFVCIEPWHGIADPAGFTGDYRDKPGVFAVAPGETWRCSMRVTLVA